ncbi:MAG: tetratricopeptide repeat protein [Candidatus Rokubacteria bacterium]|nr:tetratricopeptide repeat protein [Candidatus Rokubacteria bacterium]
MMALHAPRRTLGSILGAVILLLALGGSGPARAQSPLAAEADRLRLRYHEDPARLDAIRAELEQVLRADSHVDNWLALAQVCFIWGDVRARTREERLAAYERGRQAGERAVELRPRDAIAHLLYAINIARWGQVNGVVRSLFLLPTVKREIDTILELDPTLPPAYSLAGNVYAEVPALLGGDLERSEQMFRKGLTIDPQFTSLRVGLARTLIKQGRIDEARHELRTVIAEKAPRNPADWTVKEAPEARRILASLERRS